MHIIITRTDHTTYEVDAIVRDRVAASENRHRRNWPTMTEDPDLHSLYIAFSAARRTGQFTGTWSDFQDQTETIEQPDEDDELPDPTRTATTAD